MYSLKILRLLTVMMEVWVKAPEILLGATN